jgi:hypothetical protein
VLVDAFVLSRPCDVLDVGAILARLHEETERVRQLLDPMPDLITFVSNRAAHRLKRYDDPVRSEKESNTVVVDLRIETPEIETKLVRLYVDNSRDICAYGDDAENVSGCADTRFVSLKIDFPPREYPARSYPRYSRRRSQDN